MTQTFHQDEVKRLCEATLHFGVTLVKYLGQGGFNMAWEVKRAGSPPLVLRISLQPTLISNLESELDLYRTMHGFHIGLPFVDGYVFLRARNKGILAVLTEKGKGTLHTYLRGSISVRASPVEMAKSAIEAVRHSSSCDFFFGDIKTENMLVTENKVFMADFDPKYCQKETWITRFCRAKGIISDCNLDVRSRNTLRDLLTRVMIFQLHFFVHRYYTQPHATEFANALYRHGVESLKQPIRGEIRIGKTTVDPVEVLEHLLDLRYPNILNGYTGKYNTVQSQNFRDAISNFLTLQKLTPPASPSRQVIVISSNSNSNSPKLSLRVSSSNNSVTSKRKRKRIPTPHSGPALRASRPSPTQSPVHPLQWKRKK